MSGIIFYLQEKARAEGNSNPRLTWISLQGMRARQPGDKLRLRLVSS